MEKMDQATSLKDAGEGTMRLALACSLLHELVVTGNQSFSSQCNYVVIIIMFVVHSIGILDLLQLHEICSKTTLSVPMA